MPTQSELTIDFGRATPKQELFYKSRTLYTAFGGARGGGKTHAVRVKAVGGCIRYPGIKVLIVRRRYIDLQSNHIEPILKMVPAGLASYNGTLHTLYFANGSIIHFGHYAPATAETEYQGQEYDWIFLDEATQFTEMEFRILGGILRGVNDIPKRFYITCNPGGVGHRWVKRLFIDRKFKTDCDNPEENENPEDYSFIPAGVDDNPYLTTSSPGYVKMLSALPENMRRAHRYGDWDALSGNYFDDFSQRVHVVSPFPVPQNWAKYRSFDYGLDMFACYWIAVDERGTSYVYREIKIKNMLPNDAAKTILDCTLPNENILITFAPPDMWNRQKESGKTIAELFMLGGVPLVRADNNRVQGHIQIKQMLTGGFDRKPQLLIMSNCKELIEDLSSIQADEKNPNDCAKEPHEITHTVDALRYYCISRTLKGEKRKERQSREYDDDDDNIEEYSDFMTGGAASSSYIGY